MENDDARRWTFWQARPTKAHALALALRRRAARPAGAELARVHMWRCVPASPVRELLPAPVVSGEEERAEP
jgi:hypothetical protein